MLITQLLVLVAAAAGVGLCLSTHAVHERWWVTVLIGLVAISINGVVVPIGGLLLLVPGLANRKRRPFLRR